MAIDPRERRIAVSMWGVAVGMIEFRDPQARTGSRYYRHGPRLGETLR